MTGKRADRAAPLVGKGGALVTASVARFDDLSFPVAEFEKEAAGGVSA